MARQDEGRAEARRPGRIAWAVATAVMMRLRRTLTASYGDVLRAGRLSDTQFFRAPMCFGRRWHPQRSACTIHHGAASAWIVESHMTVTGWGATCDVVNLFA